MYSLPRCACAYVSRTPVFRMVQSRAGTIVRDLGDRPRDAYVPSPSATDAGPARRRPAVARSTSRPTGMPCNPAASCMIRSWFSEHRGPLGRRTRSGNVTGEQTRCDSFLMGCPNNDRRPSGFLAHSASSGSCLSPTSQCCRPWSSWRHSCDAGRCCLNCLGHSSPGASDRRYSRL